MIHQTALFVLFPVTLLYKTNPIAATGEMFGLVDFAHAVTLRSFGRSC